jgi:hypothetical protein
MQLPHRGLLRRPGAPDRFEFVSHSLPPVIASFGNLGDPHAMLRLGLRHAAEKEEVLAVIGAGTAIASPCSTRTSRSLAA